jgi:hypothetical protein
VSTLRRNRAAVALSMPELAVGLLVAAVLGVLTVAGISSVNARQQRTTAAGEVAAVLQAEQQFLSLYDTYTDHPADLAGVKAPLVITSAPAVRRHEVSIALSSRGSLGLAAATAAGTCHFRYVPGPGVPAEPSERPGNTGELCDARSVFPAGEWPLEPAGSRTSAMLSQP